MAAGNDGARSRAKWALPAEPMADNAAAQANMMDNAAEPAAPDNATAQSAGALPSDDLALFRARGNGPFWTVTVIGGTLVLDTPGKPSRYFSVEASNGGGTLRYSGQGIQLSSTPGPCHDGMSDRAYGDRVQISLSDGVLKGCGNARSGGRHTDS
ncbi:hypothetical protein BH10PSE12_BH10PSE12_35350 [soil metagenome]